jgi:suppressor for copper-sensitivity B
VNERFVLERPAVAGALRADGTVAMQADWTRPDPAIAAYLQSHGRYGIPFYAVYGPGAPQGLVLGEIVTEGGVLAALAAAR